MLYAPLILVQSWLDKCVFNRTWGLAAIGAAMAYDDPGSMKYAVEVWEQVYVYFVSPADAVAGKHSTRSVYFSSTCQGGILF